MIESLIETERVAEMAAVSKETVRQWRRRGMGPPHFKLCGAVRYREADVLAWIARCRVEPGGTA